MIDVKNKQLETGLEEVLASIRSSGSSKLFSVTKKINKKDPLRIFAGAKRLGKDRFYWVTADRTLTLTGAGKAAVIEAKNKENRYQETETDWKELQKNAWIENPFPELPGTGVVAFGGMDFDPLKETTALWEKFKPSQFYIPEIMLTIYQSGYYVTVNTLLKPDDRAEEVADKLIDLERQFLSGRAPGLEQVEIAEQVEIEPEKWKETVRKAMAEMKKKNYEKIVLARELRLHFKDNVSVSGVLDKLYETQENSYIFAFESGGDCFIGATPERLVKLEKNDLLSTCLAGTAPRGKTVEEDQRIGEALLRDKKNREEHDFVVQMIRNALEKTCTDVVLPEAPVLHPLKNLQHLYTPVTGTLKKHYSIFDVVKDLHPTPALGGTPTKKSLAFIREHELLDRGWYGAPIGWVDSNANGEFAVAIRSALIQQDEASLFAGCGVLADSDPEMEYEETRIKMLPMLNVLGGKEE